MRAEGPMQLAGSSRAAGSNGTANTPNVVLADHIYSRHYLMALSFRAREGAREPALSGAEGNLLSASSATTHVATAASAVQGAKRRPLAILYLLISIALHAGLIARGNAKYCDRARLAQVQVFPPIPEPRT